MSNICTVSIVTWLIAVISYVAHMCIHLSYKSIKFMVYIPNLRIFVSSTYFPITLKVCIAVGSVLAPMCKNVGSICPFNRLVV